ncbi:MAG: hypothetical protein ACRDRH_13580 [Pseudonocardia sp.]
MSGRHGVGATIGDLAGTLRSGIVLLDLGYDQADPVTLTRGFLSSPEMFLRHLFDNEINGGR